MNSRIEAISALGAGQISVSEEACCDSDVDKAGDEMRAFEVCGDKSPSEAGVEERDRFLEGMFGSFAALGFLVLDFADCKDSGTLSFCEALLFVFCIVLSDLVALEEAAFEVTFAGVLVAFETVAYKRLGVNRHKDGRRSMRTRTGR